MQYQYQYQVEPVNPRRQYAMAGLAVAGLIGGFLLLDWYFNRPVRAVERRQSEAAALTGGEIVPLEDMLTATATTTTMAGQTMGPIPRSVHEYMFNTYKYVAGWVRHCIALHCIRLHTSIYRLISTLLFYTNRFN